MFEGSYVALVTPFHEDGTVNFEKLKQLCNWHVENGTDGIVAVNRSRIALPLNITQRRALSASLRVK